MSLADAWLSCGATPRLTFLKPISETVMPNSSQDFEGSGDGKRGSTTYVCALAAVAALGGLLFGYDTGVISGVIGFLTERFQLDEVMKGWAVSNVLIGCMIGASVN